MTDDQTSEPSKTVKFHYIKTPLHRGIHVDGIFGGITPHGLVHLAVYSERNAIPQLTVQPIVEESTGGQVKLGDEKMDERVGREGIVRELEASLYMSPPVALALRDWIDQKLESIGFPPANKEGGEP